MSFATGLLAGAAAAAVLVLVARLLERERELAVYAVGLVVAALIYVGFAVAAGGEGWPLEAGGLVIFSLLAVLARRLPWSLALGWALHAGWDVALHGTLLPGAATAPSAPAPSGYPALCVGFDLLLAVYVVVSFRRGVPGG